MISDPNVPKKLSANEGIKERSNFLRGTILESLSDESTGAISADDAQLTKFHGTYMQDDRDKRAALIKEKKEKAYSFMIRVRVPGGVCTPAQWIGIDELADKFGESTLKLTTRQAFQLYGILKRNLKQTMKEINDTLLDTLAACGDVNRNVMSPANPFESALHQQALEVAQKIHDHLTLKHLPMRKFGSMVKKRERLAKKKKSQSMVRLICRGNSKLPSPCLPEMMWMCSQIVLDLLEFRMVIR